ncbi:TonB-dependent hemoglobin/transferrin/lactoferrin family receptor [Vibrio algarum]|uniref:TonB-dependent hemoglobin/transferrin/lactoferrin family receptor n=1 Tax=Vibrio algarum TaxID=3020714 RepID=A0ABT4YS87_9VIBR|nr:TonB-dependent hemoglobin/transferrin/lactoferrin family receptor [Vibrio sp. KJ40-1]MDB1124417.1 TonB-dependent hemoglobin/transferrin/lactoferrin family receptor [Vibrio sp. KJ40-1]
MLRKTRLAVAIGGLLTLSATTYAETYSFEEVVVSGTRTEQSKKDVSSSIDVISSDDLNNNLTNELKDVFQYTPGVDAQGSGRFGVSGVNIRGVEESRVKMMVDGVQQPSSYNPGSTEQRKYPNTIEVDTLQSIEVNKGPSSTLYGSDALGGVVLMRTKNPQDYLTTSDDEHRFGIKSGYASANDEFKTTLNWAMRKDKLETLLMATYANGHETETHGSGADIEGPDRGAANPADKELGNLLGKAFYQVNEDNRVGLTVEYYKQQYDEDELNYNGYSIMPGFTYTDNYNEDVSERLRVGFEHQMFMDTLLADSLDWSVNYQDSNSLSENYDTTPFSGRRMREREASDRTIQVDTQLSKIVMFGNNAHEFTYGATFLNNDFSLDNTDHKYDFGTVTPGSTGIPDANVMQWGLFIQDQAFFMQERLIVTAGLRFDSYTADPTTDSGYTTDYPKNEDSAVTGKLGTVYHFNDQLSVFGQVSQGFKAPTVYDLYYFYDQGAIIEANPDLKAERSTAYEMGLRGENSSARFEVAMFYNDYTDFITQEVTGEQDGKDVITKKNLDEVEIYGVEFSSTVYLDEMFSAPEGMYSRISVAYLDGEDKKTGDALDSVAPLTSVIGLGLDRDLYGAAVNVKMVAAKDDWQSDDNENVAGYTLVDFTTYYQPTQNLRLSAGLFNALDKKYWLYDDIAGRTETNSFNKDIKSQPGRNWGVAVDYQF